MSSEKVAVLPRNPGLFPANRECRRCGAKPLSRNNPGNICGPCNNGVWEEGEDEIAQRQREYREESAREAREDLAA
jgi:hypothetical protein